METTADLILFIGAASLSLLFIYIAGRIEGSKEKKELAKKRKMATNYARMAKSSGVIKKG